MLTEEPTEIRCPKCFRDTVVEEKAVVVPQEDRYLTDGGKTLHVTTRLRSLIIRCTTCGHCWDVVLRNP